MKLSRVLAREMEKSGGVVRVVKVPNERRPTAESLRTLERQISAQLDANEAMRNRSMCKAAQKSGNRF